MQVVSVLLAVSRVSQDALLRGRDAVESCTVVEEHGIVWNAGRSVEHDSTRDLARHVYWRCQFESVHARGVGKKRYFRLNLSSLSVLHRSVAALSGLDI